MDQSLMAGRRAQIHVYLCRQHNTGPLTPVSHLTYPTMEPPFDIYAAFQRILEDEEVGIHRFC